MLGLSRYDDARAVPLERSVVLDRRHGVVPFSYRVRPGADYVFTADVYAYMDNAHPERHLGWWRFELPEQHREGRLTLDFDPIRPESITLDVADATIPALDCWHNPDYAFDPLADLQFVIRDGTGEVRRLEPALLKFPDRDILREFYVRQYADHGYTPSADAPFLYDLHDYKMGRLRRLFRRHVPSGGRVVDVGCGRSLFADLGDDFPFTVFAGDLNFESVHARAVEVPRQQWAVFDAAAVPVADGRCDALFAGEVIEHVADVEETLREWWRVLRPGGAAIITTPNRERLVSIAGGLERPYSRDHLRELSYRELTRELLPGAGFEFVEQENIYLELWLRNLWNDRLVQDHLQGEGNRRRNRWLMRRLYPLGRFLPWLAMAMVVVARKRTA